MKKMHSKIKMWFTVLATCFSLATMAQDTRGVLLVNEISNGPSGPGISGGKEWVELIVGNNTTAGPADTLVDIRRWIVDDNNSIFTDSLRPNRGISAGHLRFADSTYWSSVRVGKLIVLFNGNDFDSTNSNFVNADASSRGIFENGNTVFVCVGGQTNPTRLIEVKFTTPFVADSTGSAAYCDQNIYEIRTSAWTAVSLRNDSLGDGIQVRCPGCLDVPAFSDEPSFFHGASYGGQTLHVPFQIELDGAHVSVPDSNGGTNRAIRFFSHVGSLDIGADASWDLISAAAATPGAANNANNATYINNVRANTFTFTSCPAPFEPDTTPIPGVLIVTEISNGDTAAAEYVELLVTACSDNPSATNVDIRNWVLDDNNGVFDDPGPTTGVTSGHLKFANLDTLKRVPVGTVIVLYNNRNNFYGFTKDEDFSDLKMFLPIDTIGASTATSLVEKNYSIGIVNTLPTSSNPLYCDAAYDMPSRWEARVSLGNTADAFQVRCPGCEPAFYHGVAYGTSLFAVASGSNSLGGAKVTGSGSNGTWRLTSNACNPGTGTSWTRTTAANHHLGVPATAGVVDTAVYNPIIVRRTCSIPCCAAPGAAKKANEIIHIIDQVDQDFYLGNVHPNPTTGILNMDINSNEDFTVRVLDITGREVYSHNFKATDGRSEVSLDLSHLTTGTYVYTVISNSHAQTGKVVINK